MDGKFHWDGEWGKERRGDCRVKEREYQLLKQIVTQYVYECCDYLICLDGARGSFTTFLRKEGLDAMPPSEGEDYGAVIKDCVESYVVSEDKERVLKEMELQRVLDVLDREGSHTFSYGVRGAGGEYARKSLKYVYYDSSKRLALFMRTDVTKEYREQQRQRKELVAALENARTDSLTGLWNRQEIRRQVSLLLEQAQGAPSVLFFMDLDNFKLVNDTLGHRWGDKALCRVAEAFRETLGDAGIMGRVGGDEFVAFLTGAGHPGKAGDWARRLCDCVCGLGDIGIGDLRLSCSIGGALWPADGADYDTLFVKADTAAYVAKVQGKNGYAFYASGMNMRPGIHDYEPLP